MEGFIKIHRRLLEWEWSDNPNVLSAFLHCLILANWEDKKWRGNTVKRGSFVTSISKFAAVTGLSVQQTRTAFDKLQATNEIKVIGTTQFTVIEVVNYDKYQGLNTDGNKQITNEQQANQQTNNKQITTTKKNKNIKNNKNIKDIPNGISKSQPPFDFYSFVDLWNETRGAVTGIDGRTRATDKIKKTISARLKDGYTQDDVNHVVKMAWLDRSGYHRKSGFKTLTIEHCFRPENFERYLNENENNLQNSTLETTFAKVAKDLGL